MRSQENGELLKCRKTEENREDVEEDEDEEYGARQTVKKLDPQGAEQRREKSTKRPTRRFERGADTS